MRAASFKSLYPKRPLEDSRNCARCVAGAPDTALRLLVTDGKVVSGTPVSPQRSTLELFHCNAVGTRWARFEGRVEVQFEPFVLGEGIVRDFENVGFMVAFKVNNARSIFIEEIVCHHKATIIVAQHNVVRSSVCAEADNRYLLRIEAVS